jgi:hypothetical protein
MRGVWKWCLHSDWKNGGQQRSTTLNPLGEDIEEWYSDESQENDEPQEGDPAHKDASLTAILQHLDLDSGGLDEITRAYAQIDQFNMKGTEHGQGKVAFEDYLHAALSIPQPTS